MGPEIKRVTLAIHNKWRTAYDAVEFLKSNGVNAKVVSKHAVQIHPAHVERAKELANEKPSN